MEQNQQQQQQLSNQIGNSNGIVKENDVYIKNIKFEDNDSDFKLKIKPIMNESTQEKNLILTIFSESVLYEDTKYSVCLNLQQEFDKYQILSMLFEDEEIDQVAYDFLEFFVDYEYSVEKIQENNFNQAKIVINYKQQLKKDKQKIIPLEFVLNKENIELQGTEEMVNQISKQIRKQDQENQVFQQECKQKFQNQQDLLENLIFLIQENGKKIDQFQENFNQNAQLTEKNFKITNENLQNQENTLNVKLDTFQEKIMEKVDLNQTEIKEQFEKQNENYERQVNNIQEVIENNISILQGRVEEKYNQIEEQIKNNLIEKTNLIQQQQQQFIEDKFKNNINEIKDKINIFQDEQQYNISKEIICLKLLNQHIQNIPIEILDFINIQYNSMELLKNNFIKLQESIKLIKDPLKILFIAASINEVNQQKINPKQLVMFDIKDKTVEQFKNEMQGKTNCLILTHVILEENQEELYFGGYAPDSSIFNKDKDGTRHKTQQHQNNLPYTLNLNDYDKRILSDINNEAYVQFDNQYFQFFFDLVVHKDNDLSFVCGDNTDLQYQSINGKLSKKLKWVKFKEGKIEVIQLF